MQRLKKILISENLYGVLIYLLLIGLQDTTFILSEKTYSQLKDKFEKYNLRTQKTPYNLLTKNIKIKHIIDAYIKIIYMNIYFFLNRKKYIIFGTDHTYISEPYINYGINIIEDGLFNYNFLESEYYKNNKKLKTKIKKILKFRNPFYKICGLDKKVKKIYLTGLSSIPKDIEHKVELINLKELWDKKTLKEKKEILDIFSFDKNIEEKIKGRDIILFTQPLSEDDVITEEEKINIYKEIVKKYPKEKLIIKTHPRERTNYKEIFKEYLVLDNSFPFEILNLLEIKFNKSVTIFSTAAINLGEKTEIDFYGTEIHPKIFERFGSYNNIHKITKKL